jgi:hypothetical protein
MGRILGQLCSTEKTAQAVLNFNFIFFSITIIIKKTHGKPI